MGSIELEDLLGDAEAYFAAGEVQAAADVLFEGLDEYGAQSIAADRIYAVLGGLCCSFSGKERFADGKVVTMRVVNEVLKRLGLTAEPAFKEIYIEACVATGSNPFPIRRLYRHENLIKVFRSVPVGVIGEVAECGCARGLSSLELCLTTKKLAPTWNGEGFHIFDSFEGLSEPGNKDRDFGQAGETDVTPNMKAGRYAFSLETVARNIHRHFPAVQLHPGWIPASFAEQPDRQYRFVHIDVDLYQPTFDSLQYFFPRLAAGGIAITDDYNWPGAKAAFHEFCEAEGLELHTTGTTQAFVVKTQDT